MLEVTLRTPAALACIEAIAREVPQAVVGAGTVRSAADAQAARDAGARFAVSPGFTVSVGRACRDLGLPLLPGVATGSEIMQAQEEGYTQLKFFPAMQAGGVPMLKAWSGPFGDVRFCPTGGVSAANAGEFLALPNVACVGGSWLTPSAAVAAGDWGRITALAREAVSLTRPG
jgi:2-dehydro-3-deoxyphosphogluconate aldolase/(4S)-4-hydroxy-2-oxoglutarate aldolase